MNFPLGGAGWASRDLGPGRLGEAVPSGSISGPAGADPVTKTVSVFIFFLQARSGEPPPSRFGEQGSAGILNKTVFRSRFLFFIFSKGGRGGGSRGRARRGTHPHPRKNDLNRFVKEESFRVRSAVAQPQPGLAWDAGKVEP